jgi:hypothetical protein
MPGEMSNNGEVIKDLGDIIYKLFALLASLVALKFTAIGETLFEKHYMPLVLAAVMVYFLLWIFCTLVLLHRTPPITYLFPISVLYGIVCAVSFAAFRIISPDTTFATFNLTSWLFTFIVIAFIYHQNQTVDDDDDDDDDDDVATYGSEQPVLTAVQLTVNGGGNISVEQLGSVAVQPATTQHNLDIGAEECVEVPPPCMTGFDRDYDGMVDLEENRVVMKMETDARWLL